MTLEARGVHKSLGGQAVLRGVDIVIEPGQITCLIGPSGCGKTTLLRALAFLDPPDAGAVTLDGAPPARPPWPDVTAVFQSLFLWPHLTLRENIMLPARRRNPNAQADMRGLAALLDMEHFLDKHPNQASGGQRQRAALARALILGPRYVLLDEITSALDLEQSAKILTKLTHLRERGMGVLLITHALAFARRAADRVVFMDAGRVAEAGGPGILDRPATPRLAAFLEGAGLC
ncbi:MAG: amino acid ABC transporter ATP-binding protein [Alphaproteobacteria bacterium]|jgi:polar amino acid transport system ATP-binding protein|nr:amino acid ABC transporter ATP-binding protein [Alphaproteobacteria bacterium]